MYALARITSYMREHYQEELKLTEIANMFGYSDAYLSRMFQKYANVNFTHGKGETVVISEDPLDEAQVKAAIAATGYDFKGMSSEPYQKKRFLFF